MIVTNEKITVTLEMMQLNNMSRGSQLGVPINPSDLTEGLKWKHLFDLDDNDFDKIEQYFLNTITT